MARIGSTNRVIPKCGMTKVSRMGLGMRQCPDIGLWALDNGMGNCVWKTEACADCYNRKTVIYPDMAKCWAPGGKDDQRWQAMTSRGFYGLHRVRLNTRGDAFPNIREVERVAEWVAENPMTKFWIVTRGWQTGMNGSPENWYRINEGMMRAVERKIMIHSNARVQASIDDWTKQHLPVLQDRGWNTMYFSREGNLHPGIGQSESNVIKCRKTWNVLKSPTTGRPVHRKGVCRTCRNGCFSENRVDVWLKFHW